MAGTGCYFQQLRDDLRLVDVPLKQPKRKETPPSPPPGPYLTTVSLNLVSLNPLLHTALLQL